jgi:hypothetical protein
LCTLAVRRNPLHEARFNAFVLKAQAGIELE